VRERRAEKVFEGLEEPGQATGETGFHTLRRGGRGVRPGGRARRQ
jgi:hypothetical protein